MIISTACLILFGLLLFGLTPHNMWVILRERRLNADKPRGKLKKHSRASASPSECSRRRKTGAGSVRAAFRKGHLPAGEDMGVSELEPNEPAYEEPAVETAEEEPPAVQRIGKRQRARLI